MGFFSRRTTPPEIVPTYASGARVDAGPSDEVEVSATDGPMPLTVEQLRAIRARGGTSVDVALTNTDLVDDVELLELVELEINQTAAECGLTVRSITRR
jgi:translation elongation factor EF-Tu-like GTPase